MNLNLFLVKNITGTILLLGVLPLPYGFFTILRIIVTASSIYLIVNLHTQIPNKISITLIFVSILFNPIIPIYFDKTIWIFIDIIMGIFFLALPQITPKGIRWKNS